MDDPQPMSAPEEPLFVPEGSMPPTQVDVTIVVAEVEPEVLSPVVEPVEEEMPSLASQGVVSDRLPTPTPSLHTPDKIEANEDETVSHFVLELRSLEDAAKAEIAAWDAKYVGQNSEDSSGSANAGTKRKGISSTPFVSHCTNPVVASEMDSDASDSDEEPSDDDEADEVRPFDPNLQDRPKLPIYHPGFKLTEELALNILKGFRDFIRQAQKDGYTDDEASYLWSEVMKSNKIPYRDAVKVAVAGETGAGKSALLNAILGVLNLTIEVSDQTSIIDTQLTRL
jgi:hypothetical protein